MVNILILPLNIKCKDQCRKTYIIGAHGKYNLFFDLTVRFTKRVTYCRRKKKQTHKQTNKQSSEERNEQKQGKKQKERKTETERPTSNQTNK